MNWMYQIFCFFVISLFNTALSDEVDHIYDDGEEVILWMGNARQYYNKQQTYAYYSLPFCQGPQQYLNRYRQTLTEALQGIDYAFSGLDIEFKIPIPKTIICVVEVNAEAAKAFKHAIYHQYWYEMSLDKLPIWGVIGETEERDEDKGDLACYLYTHKKFDIEYNGNQIIGVNFMNDITRVKVAANTTIIFTYEVNWIKTEETFEDRLNKYLNPTFFFDRVYWLSLLYSFMKVIVALSLVYIISLRILRKSSSLPLSLTTNTEDDNEHNFCKPPRYPMIFSALIGNGFQIVCGSLALIIYGTLNELRTEQGSMLTAAIFIYVLTCPINGYCGGGLYAKMGGKLWMTQLLLSAFIGPLLVWGVTLIISFVAGFYGITRAMGLEAIILWTLLFLFLPLFTAIGTVIAKNQGETFTNRNTIKAQLESSIEKKWFLHPLILMSLSSIFPFGTIFTSLKFLFHSFWEYQVYLGYDFMFLNVVFLFIMTLCTSIVCTHLLFKGGRYNWQWPSFLGGACIGIYIYIYTIYFYLTYSKMYAVFQGIFYFAYMTLVSLAFGVMCGAFGYYGANEFVQKVYSPIGGQKRQQNILQYVLSEKSNNPIWLVPDQPLEKPVSDIQKDTQQYDPNFPHLHSSGNAVSKVNTQDKV